MPTVKAKLHKLSALSALTLILSACGGPSSPAAPTEKDSDAPTINVIVPVATERTDAIVTATASDRNGVAAVTFRIQYANTTKDDLVVRDTEAPYAINLGRLPAGLIMVSATAEDTLGNVSFPDQDAFSVTEARTVVDSDIKVDAVWTAEHSPYVVTKSINIDETATLTLEPGVIVRGGDIHTYGKLTGIGTPDRPIQFDAFADGAYRNVTTVGPRAITLRHAVITGGLYAGPDYKSGTLTVEDSVFRQGYFGLEVTPEMNATLRRNIFLTHVEIDGWFRSVNPMIMENNLFDFKTASLRVDALDAGGLLFTKNTLLLHPSTEPRIRMDGFYGRNRTDPYEVRLKGNYLGGASQLEIETAIFDAQDARELMGRLYFDENLTAPDPATPTP